MRKRNIGLGIFFILISVVAFQEAFGLKVGSLRQPGPGFFPFLASSGIVLSCLVIFAQTLRLRRVEKRTPHGEASNWPRVLALVVLLFLFAVLMGKAGYLIMCFLSMAVMFRLYEPVPWPRTIILAVIVAYSTSLFFNYAMGLELPRGFIPYGYLGIFY